MRLLRSLVLLALAVPLVAPIGAPLGAQARVTRDAGVRAVPDGNVIATVTNGTSWRTGAARAGYTVVTLEGWVDASRVAGRRDTFPNSIGGSGTLRLRAEPSLSGRILGNFEAGAGIRVLERRGDWARVRRDGWLLSTVLAAPTAATAPARQETKAAPRATEAKAAERAADEAPAAETEPAEAPRDGALRANAALPLHAAPGTRVLGTLEGGSVVEPLARDRGWVRVRVEAWVPESLLVPADSSYRAALTAADLRLDPEAYRGRTVRWVVQVVGLQTADPLRRALSPDEPYLLAMGPSGENAILYLAVPPSLLDQARRLAPLSQVIVTARIRNGRSQPTGAPVLDLISLAKR